jgi:2-hydroxy-3-oxopropionate reductase
MNIAFIGLGIMGKPMSKNLLKAGYNLNIYDIVPAAVADVAAAGGKPAVSAAEAARGCEVIITMLPNSPQVKDVLLGGGGVVAAARQGALIIDMSSIAPEASQECAAAASAKGLRMVDAPVSGGEPKAIDGTLSIMCGGQQADFDEALPILQKMGASVVLCGPVGAGNVTKLCNQIIVGVNIAAMGEALTLAAKAGVNPETVFKAIRGGLAGSTVLEAKVPMVLNRNFKPGFKIDLHIKDLKNAIEAGRQTGSPTPFSASVLAIMEELAAAGCGQQDHSGVVQYFEKIAGVEIK